MTELETALRPPVATIRTALSDIMFTPGRQAVAELFARAPVEHCVQLAKSWSAAQAAGVPVKQVLARFDSEEQFLIELVTSVFIASTPASTGGTDLHELALMLDEPGQTV